MKKKTKITILLVGIALVLTASAISKVYYIRDGSGGTLFWRADEAYLFLGAGHTGYRFSYLRYPLVVMKEYFHAPPFPDDGRVSAIMIRVTPVSVEKYKMEFGDEHAPDFLTPFEDGFYAMCPGASLCKWTENGFRQATEDEQHKLDGVNRLVRGDMNNRIINGWHVRSAGRMPREHFEVEVGKNIIIDVQNRANNPRAYPWVSIDLLRSGQAAKNLYDVNGTPRKVSKDKYENTFER